MLDPLSQEAAQEVEQELVEGDHSTLKLHLKEVRPILHSNLLIVSPGTRGDVQPHLALSRALRKRGWRVGLCTHEEFKRMVDGEVDEFFPLAGNPSALSTEEFKKAFFQGSKWDQAKIMQRDYDIMLAQNIPRIWDYVTKFKADAILCGMTSLCECISIGQKLHIPVFIAPTAPLFPSKEMPPVGTITEPASVGAVNQAMHWAAQKVIWTAVKTRINDFRKQKLQMPPLNDFPLYKTTPELCMFSEIVAPRPSDWPAAVHVTGYWVLETQNYTPPEELTSWLSTLESPPIYFGFGSMPIADPKHILDSVLQTVKYLQRSAILCGHWSATLEPQYREHKNLFFLNEAPHDWLFPRCSIAVHHGGAGTTAASLRAGIPTVIFPVLIDQPFWAARVAALGAGPNQAVLLKDLTTGSLIQQLTEANNPLVKERAAAIGTLLQKEDGVLKAVELLEDYFQHHRHCGIVTQWQPDELAPRCSKCRAEWTWKNRRHHCRSCGSVYCVDCLALRFLPNYPGEQMICEQCWIARDTVDKLRS